MKSWLVVILLTNLTAAHACPDLEEVAAEARVIVDAESPAHRAHRIRGTGMPAAQTGGGGGFELFRDFVDLREHPAVGDRFRMDGYAIFPGTGTRAHYEVIEATPSHITVRPEGGAPLRLTSDEYWVAMTRAQDASVRAHRDPDLPRLTIDTPRTRARRSARATEWQNFVTRFEAARRNLEAGGTMSPEQRTELFESFVGILTDAGYTIRRVGTDAFIELGDPTQRGPRALDRFFRSLRDRFGDEIRITPRFIDPSEGAWGTYTPRDGEGSRPITTVDVATMVTGAPSLTVRHEAIHSLHGAAAAVRAEMRRIFTLFRERRGADIGRIDIATLRGLLPWQRELHSGTPRGVLIRGGRPEIQLHFPNGRTRWVLLEEYAAARLGLRDYREGNAISSTSAQLYYERPAGSLARVAFPDTTLPAYASAHWSDEFEAWSYELRAQVQTLTRRIRYEHARGEGVAASVRDAWGYLQSVRAFRDAEMASVRGALRATATTGFDATRMWFHSPDGEFTVIQLAQLPIDVVPGTPEAIRAARALLTQRLVLLGSATPRLSAFERTLIQLNHIASPRTGRTIALGELAPVREPRSDIDPTADTLPPPPPDGARDTLPAPPPDGARDTLPAPPPLPGAAGRPVRGVSSD